MSSQFESAAQKEATYKEEVTRSRFMHQMFLGLGGATVFGFIGVLSKELLGAAITTGAAAPIAGLVGIGLLGIACLYVGAKYLSNTIILDQDYQANKIAMAARGKAPQIAPTIETERTKTTAGPISTGAAEQPQEQQPLQADIPSPRISDIAFHQPLETDIQRAHTRSA